MNTLEGQPPKTGWENADDALRDELREQLNAALAENKRLREAVVRVLSSFGDEIKDAPYVEDMALDWVGTGDLRSAKLAEGRFMETVIKPCRDALVTARQLLADTTDAVAGMQNEVLGKNL